MGWFGPRGLASVVLALVVLEDDTELSGIDTLVLATLVTVIASIFLHGLSARALSRRYGEWARRLPEDSPELSEPATAGD
jgi:NhaP-type Na+/H+ or K+/H+ antiporter